MVRSLIVLCVAPFLLLHLLVLFFSIEEKPLQGAERIVSRQPDGQPLVTFWRRVSDPRITIIFVHGTPATATAFREQMAYHFPSADLVAYDRPGFGDSPGSSAQANLAYQSATLSGLIKHVRTEKVVLVGHSYGGPIVLQVACQSPSKVAGLVMIGGSVSPLEEHPWMIQYVVDWPLLSALLPGPIRSSNEELLQLKADLITLDQEITLVHCPVLMLQGMKDEQVPPSNVPYLKRRFDQLNKGAQFQERFYADYNHFMMWEHPAEINAELESFIQRKLGQLSYTK